MLVSMIVAPIIVMAIIGGLGVHRVKGIYKNYYTTEDAYSAVFNPMIAYNQLNEVVEEDILHILSENPDKLLNVESIAEIEHRFGGNCQVVVMAGGEYYITDVDRDSIDEKLLSQITDAAMSERTIEGGIYLGGRYQRLVKIVDFTTSNGLPGEVYIITMVEHIGPQIKSLLLIALICVAVIIVVISLCMSGWVYRSIITPLSQLKIATNNIKEGNLDFTIDTGRNDEIGELCADFEDMRKRLKESTEEKLANDKQSKELISNISHDLKTPLTAIKGYCEGIQDGIADTPEKMERYIKTIYNKTLDMTKLIDELTLYSKIDTNKIPYNFNKINLAAYFEDCVDEIRVELEAKGIELGYFNYSDASTTVIGDAEQLKRVINNIVSNSLKYMVPDRKGIINIRIKDIDDFVQIEIEDNGKGIAAKDVQYIFDRFYRTDSSRNSSQGGSGVGLSIVKKIISDHGGQVWATSKEGIGTVMYFVLRKYIEQPRKD